MATLRGLAEHCVEELKVLQTIMLLASSTELIRGKIVSQVEREREREREREMRRRRRRRRGKSFIKCHVDYL